MDGMINCGGCRHRTTALRTVRLQHADDVVMAALLCHVDETVSVVAVPFRVCARCEQDLRGFRMAFTNSEVYWRRIPVLLAAQTGIAGKHRVQGGRVARLGSRNHAPDIFAPFRAQLGWFDHRELDARPKRAYSASSLLTNTNSDVRLGSCASRRCR